MYIENNINYIIEHFKEDKADTLNVGQGHGPVHHFYQYY